jgi:DNA-binding response OmpR family regulator
MSKLPRLLIVEDEGNHARVLAIGLRAEGFFVETARDAECAMAALTGGEPFQLAVVDLMMPGINGMQLARLMRDQHPETRVVLMSAYHLSERQLYRADCGAVGFVPKPFDVAELATFLRTKLASAEPLGCVGREPKASVHPRGAAA